MFVLWVQLAAKSERVLELENVLRELVQVSHSEANLCHYILHKHTEKPECFTLYEQYLHRSDWEQHCQRPEIAQRLQRFDALLRTPAQIGFYQVLAGE